MPAATTKTKLKTLLAELVKMPTITAEKGTSKAALDWVKYQLRDLPLHVTDFTHNGTSAVVFTTRKTKHTKVMLYAHIDVVPGPPEVFQLTERNGRLYGRGVFDMKFAAAIYMQLFLDLGEDLKNYDLGLMLVTDEETGGPDGARHLVKAGWGGDAVINPDSVTGWAIQQAAKGIVRYHAVSSGEAGHGSRTWLFRSAIQELMAFLTELSDEFPGEPCGDSDHAHCTLNIGVINGGSIINQVADTAEAKFEIRVAPGYTVAQIEQLVSDIAAQYDHLSIESFSQAEPLSIDPHHPEVQRLKGIMTKVSGIEPKFTLSHGGSDSSFFAAKGMPVLMFGPPGGGHHGDAEWIGAKALDQSAEIVRRYVEQTARVN